MPEPVWINEHRLELEGARFVAAAVPLGAEADEFVIIKSPHLVRRNLALLVEEQPRRIVELGIKAGGSTALIALAASPELLFAADLETEAPPLLEQLIESRGLSTSLVTAFGLDQGDRQALASTVDQHLAKQAIDLVIDDASHILGPTTTSFEVLFPRLRAGGLYVIEDWSSECLAAKELARVLPVGTDTADRIGALNHVLHILNAPDHELPPEVLASITEVASQDPDAGSKHSLFERLVHAVAYADVSGLRDASLPPSRPLADLAVTLTMIAATSPEVIANVTADADWLSVRRGPAELDFDDFRLGDAWTDPFGYLR